jgi:hypothetical protein
MSPTTIFSATSLWAVNGLLTVTLAIVAWNADREVKRNDDQDKRLQVMERACVKMDYMSEDVSEIKGDVKKLMSRGSYDKNY